ncbi:hypothetical protein OEIGOIKO_08091 [Streptomyces chrestomyceticus JCM 4735]|uniref:Uncharacterized protein n=1 Tax=Streptomyces chrestomyceticus JCM 4735 TaxID=1306181 RepID=A0A7U9L389_9ACTN|nr:hypothetical protein [Streptomyces chrestomyceticus]GCD40234.1 hypothetical protein OEIGOIKO_08091 [Streptomyces chrestomyceticus JCM 4735]
MKTLPQHVMIDVSAYDSELVDGRLQATDGRLVSELVRLVTEGDGVAVCHGVAKTLTRHGLDVGKEQDAAVARDYLESLFRAFGERVDVDRFSPVAMDYDRIAGMDVDGYNKNTHFTPNGDHTTEREFLTTKCVHFDAATPFIGNIYGPNTNIAGGTPMVCDTRAYCQERGVTPADLLELMPHSFNVAVKEEHAEPVLSGYAAAVDADLSADLVMVVLLNEVDGGLAHAGSEPRPADPARPARRPIRHLEYQFAEDVELAKWYRHYQLAIPQPSLQVPDEAARERYHRGIDPVGAGQ